MTELLDIVRYIIALFCILIIGASKASEVKGACENVFPINITNFDLFSELNYLSSISKSNFTNKPVNYLNFSSKIERNENKVSRERTDVKILELWQRFPNVLVPVSSESVKCRKHSRMLLKGLDRLDLWALKMIDASAKLSSGILNGNVNQYGDFDQCLSVTSHDAAIYKNSAADNLIEGKYCLAELDIRLGSEHPLNKIDPLFHAHDVISSNLYDPGHRVPRFSSISWGICMPASCSAEDLRRELKVSMKDVALGIRIEDKMCYTSSRLESPKEVDSSFGKRFSTTFFSAIVLFTILGTIIDRSNYKLANKNPVVDIITSFSVTRNWNRLKYINKSDQSLAGLHGIRALNALALLLSHKQMAMFYYPMINRTRMSEVLGMPWAVIGRTAIIYTDSFMLMSGLLTAYSLAGELAKSGKINIVDKVVTRIFRIMPNLLAVIMFCTYVLPELNQGPQWNLVVREHSEQCKQNMWRSFLLIHNFFGFETMCLTHTHQVGIDMQLFLVTPLAVWGLWKWPRRSFWTIVSLGIVSTAMRYQVTLDKELGPMVHFGMPVMRFFKTANYSYILPTHRLTIYAMGVLLGYLLRQKGFQLKLTKFQLSLCWVVFPCLGLLAMIGPYHMGLRGYTYDPIHEAIYGPISPVVWGLFISWIILSVKFNYAGWLGDLLSCKLFQLFTNISYGVYLIQFPVFFYNIGILRTAAYYTPGMMFDIPEFGAIILLSIALTVFVEYPFQEVRKIIFESRKGKTLF